MESTLGLAADWLEKSRDTGAGGTCFSLTWWLAGRIRALGMECAFLMGDKGRSLNIHCGLRFDWEGRAHLLDPGFMIFEPIPLPVAGLSAAAWISPNEVRVEDLPALDVWRLWSGPRGAVKQRFDFRKAAVGEAEFLAHWEASYALPMMRYPVLNRVKDGSQFYLQKRSLLVRIARRGRNAKAGSGRNDGNVAGHLRHSRSAGPGSVGRGARRGREFLPEVTRTAGAMGAGARGGRSAHGYAHGIPPGTVPLPRRRLPFDRRKTT